SPMSRRWGEQLKRLLHPTAQENRKGRLGSPSRCKGGSDGKNEARACPWLVFTALTGAGIAG
ncbi:MAG: hypothetical protein OXU61_02415, partial [Gammaproteobacteria bacterium]|nr:hypothetical protein [Gammaproteobacteria bacterium]